MHNFALDVFIIFGLKIKYDFFTFLQSYCNKKKKIINISYKLNIF